MGSGERLHDLDRELKATVVKDDIDATEFSRVMNQVRDVQREIEIRDLYPVDVEITIQVTKQ